MKFELDKNQNLLVTLNKKDMKKLEITYDELDSESIETRRVIWTVLGEAKSFLGDNVPIYERLFIEVSPQDKGGCLMLFCPINNKCDPEKNKFILKKDAEPILFCAFNITAFIDALKFLKSLKSSFKDFLSYEYKGNFYIILYPLTNSESKFLFSLREFGEIDGFNKYDLSQIYEFGKKLPNLS